VLEVGGTTVLDGDDPVTGALDEVLVVAPDAAVFEAAGLPQAARASRPAPIAAALSQR
jgi:hypothetical protein